ncbi:isocitrate lyase/PEP mutase family protein [Photobacterium galatheae]|uniref:Carboxyvinyl-carboxyphosphonate phosphorylmutase n=1 Tax=Photobacterium galatheae TaxID=1654360 RepID=A0A066RVK5_9GAMM|nr:isocitrate lyase/phosphoenolpyruvate mutase family protein [Photobacterium galatheae]KDM93126.1 carboxyvinyl-carboxyphosphonate phosphorylmutase [Photobacterium galatheae]MCM0148346.1 isocitrate lyase/phosphoenolpyruvate mutase family protein [Photobacterium galatheae]
MQEFKQLHQQTTPFIIGNVWDAASARCAQQAGYQALGTSSAAIASLLGYEDGEQIPFAELVFMVRRIAAVSKLPLSVDIEAGFSRNPEVIALHIQQLAALGVAGINIEDSRVDADRTLVPAEEFAAILSAVKAILQHDQTEVFLNVRCDAFLLGLDNACAETVKRAQIYQMAGADGLFVPCLTQAEHIKAVVAASRLPVNVMAMPDLPYFEVLAGLGVKRISSGNFAHDVMHRHLLNQMVEMKQSGSCKSLFGSSTAG